MRRGVVALSILALMLLAGCLSTTTATWGEDNGQVKVDFSTESVTAISSLGDDKETFSQMTPVGCNAGQDTQTLDEGGSPISFTGYLAASQFYETHNELYGAKDLDLAVTASVAIQSMSMNEAANVDGEQIPRVQVKNWMLPLYPETGAGNIDLDEVDMDSSSKWFVLGLIPTTENILYGMQALGEWHQPVQIEGYLLESNSTISPGYFSSYHEVGSNCEMAIGQNNIESVYLMVTSIQLENSNVSPQGDSSDEWVLGEVPYLGRNGFIMFFLIFGIGGAVAMFMFSKIAVSRGATASMEVLVGKKAMAAVSKVKEDIKQAKAGGMKTSKQRNAEARGSVENETKKSPKKKSTEVENLAGFDLDSALNSGPSESATEFGSKSSSVVATAESQNFDSQRSSFAANKTAQKSTSSAPVTSASPTSAVRTSSAKSTVANVSATPTRSSVISNSEPKENKRTHFSSIATGNSAPLQQPKKKVVKKRAAKKAKQAEPWTEPVTESQPQAESSIDKSNSFEEDEDFSDFSM